MYIPGVVESAATQTELEAVSRETQLIDEQLDEKLTDAPSDGTTYGRNNGAWVAAGGGSSVYSMLKRSSTDTSNAAPTLIIPWQTAGLSSGSDVTWSGTNNTRITCVSAGTYTVGGYVTYQSATQRAQASVEILLSGTGTGVFRGQSYVRNSGSAWDYWCIEISPEPFTVGAGAYFEFRLSRNSGAGATYGTGGTGTITHRGTASAIWVQRVA